jgi:Zn-dependent peptidase ImmA (M78 family)
MNPYHARSQAEALIKQLRISEPPIDVEDLAKRLGLNVLYEELGGEDVSGALVRTKEGANVLVQASDPKNRQRFTIAHEIAHFQLEHCFPGERHVHVDKGNFYRSRNSLSAAGVDPMEIEANQFAASLLMPTDLVKREVQALQAKPLLDQHVALLAKRFGVSEHAMTIRLTRLGCL